MNEKQTKTLRIVQKTYLGLKTRVSSPHSCVLVPVPFHPRVVVQLLAIHLHDVVVVVVAMHVIHVVY